MELLKRLFYDTKTGLRSSSLYTKAKEIDPTITRKLVKEFLEKQNVVQVFKPRKIKAFYPLIATKHGRIQIDQIRVISCAEQLQNHGGKTGNRSSCYDSGEASQCSS